MKMSKKTRILSVLLCVAVMMGIMSVGLMANAANTEAPGIDWSASNPDLWGPNELNLYQVNDGYIVVDATGSGISSNQWTIGGWGKAYNNLGNFAGCDGVTFAVRIDSASGNPSRLNANLKLFVGETCFQNAQAIPVGGGTVQVVLPFEAFSADGNSALLMTPEHVEAISNFQMVINSYDIFWGNSFQDAVYTVSDIYGYTGEPDPITLPGDEPESTTAEPTTAEPTTEAPTTEAPAPTTVAPAPTTAAPAPTTVAPAPTTAAVKAATPAKVKKVTAKSKAKKKVVVTWKAAKNAKKYIVKYSYKKNMKSAKTVTVKKAKATLKKLKSGKKVYIQVQGVNGKVKGKFSAKKSVKVK